MDHEVRAKYLRLIGFQPSKSLSEAFGKLPRRSIKELEESVIGAVEHYYWSRPAEGLSPPSTKAHHYEQVRGAAERLSGSLGLDPGDVAERQASAPLEPELDAGLGIALCQAMIDQAQIDDDTYQVLAAAWPPPGGAVVEGMLRGNKILLTHHSALRIVTLFLKSLIRAAQRAYTDAIKDVEPGKGGQRRTQRKPTTSLLRELVAVYAVMRERYPKSGPQLGYSNGGPLERFIRAALACAPNEYPELQHISEGAIRAAYRRHSLCGQIKDFHN